jgi:NAD-dependent dihydropyrimidine dehydrogenase PreA subunit
MCGPCCPGKPNVKQLNVGGQSIGIAGLDEVMTRGLARLDLSDAEQKDVLMDELKKHNYVPANLEKQYLEAIWAEFKPLRAKKLGQIDDRYHGIPREEIQWFPRIDYAKCSGCQACFKFCKRGVYILEDSPKVTNPYRCVVTCTGCTSVCKEGAISFPSLVDLREELKVLRKKHGLIKE